MSATVAVAVGVVCVLMTILWLHQRRRFAFFSSRGIHGPPPTPLVGHLPLLMQTPWMPGEEERIQKYGRVHGTFQGMTPRLVVADPDLLKLIMVQDASHFLDFNASLFAHPIEQQLSFVLNGDAWSTRRKILTPSFSPQKLKAMMPLMRESVDHLLQQLELLATDETQEVKTRDLFKNFALETIARTGLGIEVNLHQQTDPLMEAIKRFFTVRLWKLLPLVILPFRLRSALRFTIFDKEALESAALLVEAVVRERRATLHEKRSFEDFTQILLTTRSKEGVGLTQEEIVGSILTMFLGGIETTSVMLVSSCFLLATHAAAQERARQEVRDVLAAAGACGDCLDSDALLTI